MAEKVFTFVFGLLSVVQTLWVR